MPSKRSPKPRGRSRARPSPPYPAGFHTVTPELAVEGGVAALEFYCKAFGAKELRRQVTPGGKLVHGRIRIGDSIVMLSDLFPGTDRVAPSNVGSSTVALHIYTNDVEKLWNRAVDAGAKVTMPLEDQFWGERYGHLIDPFGHHWSLSQRIRMSKAVREAKRKEAMAAFARGEHPRNEPAGTDI